MCWCSSDLLVNGMISILTLRARTIRTGILRRELDVCVRISSTFFSSSSFSAASGFITRPGGSFCDVPVWVVCLSQNIYMSTPHSNTNVRLRINSSKSCFPRLARFSLELTTTPTLSSSCCTTVRARSIICSNSFDFT